MIMKYYITIILLMAFYSSYGKTLLHIGLKSNTNEDVTRDIEVVDDGYIITYYFNKAILENDLLYTGALYIEMKGFGHNTIVEEPSFLCRWDTFVFPHDTGVSVSVVDSSFVTIPNFIMSPARPELQNNISDGYSVDNVKPIKAYEGFFPISVIRDVKNSSYRNDNIFDICVCPTKYNYKNKIVQVYNKIQYKITVHSPDGEAFVKVNNAVDKTDAFLKNTALNYHTITNSRIQKESVSISDSCKTKGYLILTTPKYDEEVSVFANWKRTMGFNVSVLSRNDWDAEMIDSTVSNAYCQDSTLRYLLIVGDHEDVPAKESSLLWQTRYVNGVTESYQETHFTDYQYACVTNDSFSDILHGRLSVSTEEEAETVINKIIRYEKTPVFDPIFYKTALHCAYFQDDPKKNTLGEYVRDGVEDRRFVKTSEDIRDTLKNHHQLTINRVYNTRPQVTPQRWSTSYSYGDSIPVELRRPTFAWDGDSIDIKNNINEGVFYILFRDHGVEGGWWDPRFTNNQINGLENGNKLPVVFSICCRTGVFANETCLAESFIRKQNGGCVGIYAATAVSYSGYNDVMSAGMFDAIWPNPPLLIDIPKSNYDMATHEPIYELGGILKQGLIRLEETGYHTSNYRLYTREIFHCFGDPSMEIITECPNEFLNAYVCREENRIFVDTGGDVAYISFFDKINNRTTNYYGTGAVYPFSNDSVVVCIHAHNRIPYIDDPQSDLYIQNMNISGPAHFRGNNIYVGTHVTNTKPHGRVNLSGGAIVLEGKNITIEGATSVTVGTDFEILNKEE